MSQVPEEKRSIDKIASLIKKAQGLDASDQFEEKTVPVADMGSEDSTEPADKGSETDVAPAETATQEDSQSEDDAAIGVEGEDTPSDEVTDFISAKLKNMLDQQIGNELYAFYEYTAASSWFQRNGLLGFACWATKQASDEITHMQKVMCFLNEADLSPVLPSLSSPSTEYSSPQSAVESVLAREKEVTANWRAIGAEALRSNDTATLDLAQFYVREQMEEEDSAKTILDQMKYGDILIVDMGLRG